MNKLKSCLCGAGSDQLKLCQDCYRMCFLRCSLCGKSTVSVHNYYSEAREAWNKMRTEETSVSTVRSLLDVTEKEIKEAVEDVVKEEHFYGFEEDQKDEDLTLLSEEEIDALLEGVNPAHAVKKPLCPEWKNCARAIDCVDCANYKKTFFELKPRPLLNKETLDKINDLVKRKENYEYLLGGSGDFLVADEMEIYRRTNVERKIIVEVIGTVINELKTELKSLGYGEED